LYSCLLKEHLELQREYQFLQNRLKRVLAEPNRTRLKLEHELAATRTHVRKLKRLLAEQEGTKDKFSICHATGREVSGSIPSGVTGDFFRGYRRNHVPWGRLSL
jgi:predicted nuclease with TOPRIM domain